MNSPLNVLLVTMPWASLDRPSLSLAMLSAAVRSAPETGDIQPSIINANLLWAEFVLERTDGKITPVQFDEYGLELYGLSLGDWIFTSSFYGEPWCVERLEQWCVANKTEPSVVVELHQLAPVFIERLADRLVADFAPDVVGFTNTFQQTMPSFALAQALKRRSNTIQTVMGGSNCDGEMGAALQRNFPHVIDFVVRGEGETSFPQLLARLSGSCDAAELADIRGVCWTSADGTHLVNEMAAETIDLATLAPCDFDQYFEDLAGSPVEAFLDPMIVFESSRGCWWGQKHHCTFCGLNGSLMRYRSRPADQTYDHLVSLVQRYKSVRIQAVDNIIDMSYFNTLLPRLAELDWDANIFYEVKSSLRRKQLEALVAAGVHSLQPGIESLSSRVLGIMDKGTSGCQGVRLLRDAASLDMAIAWNILYGFPGEEAADYAPILTQIAALTHLECPHGCAGITIERFSPYFNKPELGFERILPGSFYDLLYELPIEEKFDIAFIFDSDELGLSAVAPDLVVALNEAVDDWRVTFGSVRLVIWDEGDQLVLSNTRPGFTWSTMVINDPVEMRLYRLLAEPRLVKKLVAELTGELAENKLRLVLDKWVRLGLLFTDADEYVTLATEPVNREVHGQSATELAARSDAATMSSGVAWR